MSQASETCNRMHSSIIQTLPWKIHAKGVDIRFTSWAPKYHRVLIEVKECGHNKKDRFCVKQKDFQAHYFLLYHHKTQIYYLLRVKTVPKPNGNATSVSINFAETNALIISKDQREVISYIQTL